MPVLDCSSCGKKLKVSVDSAGKRARCPGCGHVIIIPAAASTADNATPLGDQSSAASAWISLLSPPQGPSNELGRLGPYRILRLLGQGGMGVVFQAEDVKLNRQVALKVLRPGETVDQLATQRFLREAQSMAAVEHPNIVRLYQVGEDRGVPFLAMELLKGESLADRIERETTLSIAESLRIGRQIAAGLEAAHAQGLIHRDIKPGNIWLEASTGLVKILDFGLARRTDSQLTQAGVVLGSPGYIAPEQGRGESVDSRTDLFSLGAVLYNMVTGRLPFEGKTLIAVLLKMAKGCPQPPQLLNFDTPSELSDLILRLLAKNPTDRCESAQEVIRRLTEIDRSLQPDSGPIPPLANEPPQRDKTDTPRGPFPRTWLVAAIAGLLAVGTSVGLIWFFRSP